MSIFFSSPSSPLPPLHPNSAGINNPLLSRLQKNSAEREEEGEKEEERIKEEGNVLNLSHQAQSDVPDDSLRWEHSLWREKYVGLCLMITLRMFCINLDPLTYLIQSQI